MKTEPELSRCIGAALVGIVVSVVAVQSALHGAVITGSRTVTGSGLVATDGWTSTNGGYQVSWEIAWNGLNWDYKYTFLNESANTLTKLTSHFLLEVSSDFTQDDLIGIDLSAEGNAGPTTFTKDPDFPANGPPTNPGANNANPWLPADLFGIKLDWGEAVDNMVTFQSTRAPMWGDFYAKDGRQGGSGAGSDVVATVHNAGIGTDPGTVDFPLTESEVTAGNANNWSEFNQWVAVPDTEEGGPPPSIPEPASILVWGLLGLTMFGAARRRQTPA